MLVAVAFNWAVESAVPETIGEGCDHASTGTAGFTVIFVVIGAGVLKSVVSLGVKVAVSV